MQAYGDGAVPRGHRGGLAPAIRVAAAAALALGWLLLPGTATPAANTAAAVPTGAVVAWGDSSKGKTTVPDAAKSGVVSVAAGCNHSLALKANGSVIAWGDNTYGQLNVPAAAGSKVIGIVAGCNHSLAMKSTGQIVAWGDNTYGQLNVPSLPSGWKWTNVAAGSRHSTAIARASGAVDVYVFGDRSNGQSDVPPSDSDSYYGEYSYVDRHDIVDVEAGGDRTMARMRDGSILVWGGGPQSVLNPPSGLSGVTWMSMGQEHALVVRSGVNVVAWGENSYGQTKVPAGIKATAVAAGGYHSLALLSNGQIAAWGRNTSGQASLSSLRTGSRYIWVAGGLSHSLAVVQATPAAPTNVTTTQWSGAVSVSWTAPEDSGHSPITSYTVTSDPESKTCTTSGALSCTVGGLTDGVSYTFVVNAANAIGTGPSSQPTAPVVPGEPSAATLEPTPTPETTPALTATPAPGGGGGTGGGGLPLVPIVILVAAGVGIGLAIVYRSAILARIEALRQPVEPPPSDPGDGPPPE